MYIIWVCRSGSTLRDGALFLQMSSIVRNMTCEQLSKDPRTIANIVNAFARAGQRLWAVVTPVIMALRSSDCTLYAFKSVRVQLFILHKVSHKWKTWQMIRKYVRCHMITNVTNLPHDYRRMQTARNFEAYVMWLYTQECGTNHYSVTRRELHAWLIRAS